MRLIRNERAILMLAIGLILTVSVVVAAISVGVRPIPEGSDTIGAPREIRPSNQTAGSPGSSVIGTPIDEGGDPLVKNSGAPGNGSTTPASKNATNEPNSSNSPPPYPTGTASPSPTSELNPSSTVMPSPTEDGGDFPAPTVTPSPVAASSRAPTGNLLVNPYFEGDHSSTAISGWVNNGQWDISVKPHNPSPNDTAVRINDPAQHGEYQLGETAVIYQIVEGGGSNLAASIACVQHYAEIMQVTILGSQSSGGPWTPVWHPFDISVCGFADWGSTVHSQTQLPQAWSYYQFRIVGRYVDERGGVKVTNASFSIE